MGKAAFIHSVNQIMHPGNVIHMTQQKQTNEHKHLQQVSFNFGCHYQKQHTNLFIKKLTRNNISCIYVKSLIKKSIEANERGTVNAEQLTTNNINRQFLWSVLTNNQFIFTRLCYKVDDHGKVRRVKV